MKLASLAQGGPDGTLILVSSDNRRYLSAGASVPTLQHALDDWDRAAPMLHAIASRLDNGEGRDLPTSALGAPLPRAWQWLDGSAFAVHGERMDAALGVSAVRHAVPLMYQGVSHQFHGPSDDIPFGTEAHGIDFEGEFGIITGPVPMGASLAQCRDSIRLVVLINDWSLRALAGREMSTGFGWIQAKPPCSVAPFAVTPDALGTQWHNWRVGLNLQVWLDDARFGDVSAAEMDWGFDELVQHAAATRPLCAGTLIGSGTVANRDIDNRGSACIAERRAHESITLGEAKTQYLHFGQHVRMTAADAFGRSVFGDIDQAVVRADPATGETSWPR